MHEELTQVRLPGGETLKIVVVEAPDDEHAGTVLNLLSHKGQLRQWQFEEDFAGRAEGLLSRYYLGFLEGRAVANISVWESGPTGDLGHVYTVAEARRQGICKAVMAAQMDDFRRRGGQCLVLGTGYDSPPYHIYASFGFRSMVPGSGSMVYLSQPDFFEVHFAPAAVTCRAAQWRDLGQVCALMALPDGDCLRSRRAHSFGPVCYEAAFVEDMRQAGRGERQVRVARTPDGVVAAYAVLGPDTTWGGRVWLLDLFVHPAFGDAVAPLLEQMTWPEAPVHCYLDADSAARAAVQGCGFGCLTELPALLRRQDRPVDVALWSRP